MSQDVNDFLMSGGVPAFSFESIGDEVEGIVVMSEVRPQTDFETGEIVTWPDGNPKMQLIVDLQTTLRDPEKAFDDGIRRLYAKANLLTAIRNAVKSSGGRLLNGGYLKATHSALGTPPKKGLAAPKLFTAEYRAPENAGISADDLA
jgi:hypothetical protein